MGELISVEKEYVAIPITGDSGKNIAVLGSNERDNNIAVGILSSIAFSLACQNPSSNLIVCDFSGQNIEIFLNQMLQFSNRIELVEPQDFQARIKELEGQTTGDEVYIFAFELEPVFTKK